MLHENIGINEKGHLTFAGCDTVELAGKYGTPVYLLDENRIRRNCRVYTSAMREFFGGDSGPLFASKALSFRGIYRIMKEEGMVSFILRRVRVFRWSARTFTEIIKQMRIFRLRWMRT